MARAATYARQWELMTSSAFRGRVTMALLHVATDVWNEPETDPSGLGRRRRFAWQVMNAPEGYVASFLSSVCSNPTIAAAGPDQSEDDDLYFVISSKWDQVAP